LSVQSLSKQVFITGATGALGRALAVEYARQGADLLLQGRNADKLNAVANEVRALAVRVEIWLQDLNELDDTLVGLEKLLSEQVPDVFIANAGINISVNDNGVGESPQAMNDLIDLNIKSTMMMTNLVAVAMVERGSGQVALLSSLAGYFGLPLTPSYSASKAALKSYGEALRGQLKASGVGVSVIMPGYIESDMSSDMAGPKPFLWKPEKAALLLRKGIDKNRARVSFPFPLNLGTWFLAVMPPTLSLMFLKLFDYFPNRKPS